MWSGLERCKLWNIEKHHSSSLDWLWATILSASSCLRSEGWRGWRDWYLERGLRLFTWPQLINPFIRINLRIKPGLIIPQKITAGMDPLPQIAQINKNGSILFTNHINHNNWESNEHLDHWSFEATSISKSKN